jgi:hypothetical protein
MADPDAEARNAARGPTILNGIQAEFQALTKDEKEAKKIEMGKDILHFIKQKAWRTTKFVDSEEQETKVSYKYLDFEDWPEMDPTSREGMGLRKEWIATYGGEVMKALNKHRSNVNSGLKDVLNDWQVDEDALVASYSPGTEEGIEARELPTLDEMMGCLERKLELDQGDNNHIAMWYVDVWLPKVAGAPNTHWCEAQRWYHRISDCAPKNTPNSKVITCGTEAYGVMFFENARNYALAYHKFCTKNKGKTPKLRIKKKKSPTEIENIEKEAANSKKTKLVWVDDEEDIAKYGDFKTKWSRPDSGQQRWGGWKRGGLLKVQELTGVNKKARANRRSAVWEARVLELLRQKHGITGKKISDDRRKRRKAAGATRAPAEDVIEFEEEE